MAWLMFWVVFAVVLSGFCSLLEATFLSVSTPMLLDLARRNDRGEGALLDIRQRRSADAISAILTVNTLAGMVGATFAGAAAASLWGDGSVAGLSAVLTGLMLFVSEIGPKTFAAAHPYRLAGWAGRTLSIMMQVMAPILPITRAATRWLAGNGSSAVTRRGLAATIAAAPVEGALSEPESELLTHIVYVHGVTLARIRTPLALVAMVPESATIDEFLADPNVDAFSRIPIYRGRPSELVGYVLHRDVLKYVATGGRRDAVVADFVRPLPRLSATLTLRAATDQLLKAREAIAAVIGTDQAVAGIVTLEDLLETLTGIEITDEAPEVSGLRPVAETARRQRIAALQEEERRWAAAPESAEEQGGGTP
jgi:CBS domain containing-hemolysin-like protein